jgi:RND family efflux transporter MFP subunit
MKLNGLKRLRLGKPTLIVVGAIALVAVLIGTKPDRAPEQRQERAWAVDIIEARPGTLSPTLELFGQVQSPQDAELSAGIEAVVVSMPVRDGNLVAKDETLLILDDRDARLALKQTEADLKEARAQMNFANIRLTRSRQAYGKEQELLRINEERASRAEDLLTEGLLSKADGDTARENLARQELALNQAELAVEENSAKLIELEARIARIGAQRDAAQIELDRTQIKAPFSGVISDLQVSEGDRVRKGDTLMRLQNPQAIEIRAQLPSRLARSVGEKIQQGDTITARVELDDTLVTGRLLRVSGQVSAGSGGVDAFIGLNSSMSGARLGSTVRVVLELPAEPNVIAVPGEAIYGSDRLYKIDAERMQMITVERVGEREYGDGSTEVLVRTPMLNPGEKIVITKLANAADGLLVKQNAGASRAQSESVRAADAGTPVPE